MVSRQFNTLTSALLIMVGFAAVFALTGFVERQRPPLPENYADSDPTLEAAKIKGFVFGTEGLLADWYWMNSLQYIGRKIADSGTDTINLDDLRSLNPRLLYPYLNNTVDLDPHFIPPYAYGATVLPAIDPEQAIALTEKGIANNPDEWRLYQYLGFIYWRQKKYDKAAEIYTAGAKIADAPPFMEMMAASMRTKGGSRDLARSMYQAMIDESDNKSTIESAQLRLMELDSLDERDSIRSAMHSFREKTGRCPANWPELLPTLKNFPLANGKDLRIDDKNNIVDPSGAAYVLDREQCDVKLDGAASKIPLL